MKPEFYHIQNDFLKKVIDAIEQNLGKEEFGVSELADEVNMSRSNLLRRVKKTTDLSVSRLIREVRLHHAKEFLKDESYSISEISYRVGFGSVSYFIKCFREQYGYPPGEEVKRPDEIKKAVTKERPRWVIPAIGLIAIGAIVLSVIFFKGNDQQHEPIEKSIAVLPFKNDSQDSTNLYLINGLMEAILNNLQKIEDLRVVSRTSVEKYRNQTKSIPEIAEELNVSYFVEGSGQKVGDQILLTIQLIEAPQDKHLWSERYDKEARDIFNLQMEVATDIALQIEAIITPEEQQRIEKIPTDNLVAYDHYLKGLAFAKEEDLILLDSALKYFEMAIAEDDQFALPHAYVAICLYFKDIFHAEKVYGDEINTYADKALFIDSELEESLIAKAMFYMQDGQHELAIEYFEKVLEYNPNSGWTHNFLSDIYTNYLPDTKKYLASALRGIRLGLGQDSAGTSISYLHLANALAQTGFIEEAEKSIDKSLAFNPDNIFSMYVRAYILMAQDLDMDRTKSMLIETLYKDTTRVDVIQEIAKTCYTMRDYEESLHYYEKFLYVKNLFGLELFASENVKIGFVLDQLGRNEEAKTYFEKYRMFAEDNQSSFRHLLISTYYAATGDIDKGIEHLRAFSEQDNFQYWIIFISEDPIISTMKDHQDFNPIIENINSKFWKKHDEMEEFLKEEGLL